MHGLLRCNINAVVRAPRSGCVTQRCHNSPDGKRGYRVQVTSRTGSARRIWGILKNSLSWVLPREKTVDFRLLAEALGRCRTRWGGGRWKGQSRKNVYLSPYVEKPLNSTVIKSFVPELRSRKCFSCFGIPMLSMYICYEHPMYVSYISMYHGYGTKSRSMSSVKIKYLWMHENYKAKNRFGIRILELYIYIYIYMLSLKKKPKTGYFRIINLFPSCFVFPTTRRKI